jgi:hypothetical protein
LDGIRGWVSVRDAAHRSSTDDQKVAEKDLLQMGLDGELTLSVKFVDQGLGRLGRLVKREETTSPPKQIGQPSSRVKVSEHHDLVFDEDTPTTIRGLWDLAMKGDERQEVIRRLRRITSGPARPASDYSSGPTGSLPLRRVFLLNRPDGTWCQLYRLVPDGHVTLPSPANRLPDDAHLVVRTSAIDDLKARMSASSSHDRVKPGVLDKPLGERERVSLYRIVRALAKAAGIDIAKHSKAGEIISAMTDETKGEKVAPRTVAHHLKKIHEEL